MEDRTNPRPYRKRKRAEGEEATRRRITEALVELHRTVGPANTKVTDLADRAGVSRMTVYNHFPTEADLVGACSAHWMAANPSPDPSLWEEIADPSHRLRVGLEELYEWYRGTEGMMGNILRDAPIVEALGDIMDGFWWPYLEQVVRVLAEGWPPSVSGRADLTAALRLVVDFSSWRTLSRSGIGDAQAADLAALMVSAVAVPRERG